MSEIFSPRSKRLFLSGFARAIDLGNTLSSEFLSRSANDVDATALALDFRVIGDDMWSAVLSVQNESDVSKTVSSNPEFAHKLIELLNEQAK